MQVKNRQKNPILLRQFKSAQESHLRPLVGCMTAALYSSDRTIKLIRLGRSQTAILSFATTNKIHEEMKASDIMTERHRYGRAGDGRNV